MSVNHYFQSGIPGGRTSEQRLLESIIIEGLKIYGHEVLYIPRKMVKFDQLFGEDTLSKFEYALPIEMYLADVNGFSGEGDFVSKFGIEIRDQCTWIVSKMRWEEAVGRHNLTILEQRPCEGDLIFFPQTRSLFEIKHADTKNPFFQLGKMYVFTLKCELFVYSNERLETGIDEVDEIAERNDLNIYNYNFVLENGYNLLTETGLPLVLEEYIVDNIIPAADNEAIRSESEDYMNWCEANPFGEVKK